MDYSMQGSKDSYSYSPQVHNLYPDAQPQPGLYPPPPPPPANPERGYGYQYQGYFGEAANPPPYAGRWPEQAAPAPSDGDPFYYQDDADCITFLRGCVAGLCCCCLLGPGAMLLLRRSVV
ncbi:hypothetical protein BDA96_06G062800 [Sorghum bicolor]|uniref:Cysteine-rich transmembrane CYSTM domain-containing protein n=2 Tax=Sorghum bicolor TaxID=4558 RepID=A0A921QNW3_SORBI|nr:hypothetical protein BDA96_06G062800 [Sorghum bicolor]OQU81426.1 hypothetical protein SORBI_3006G055900 [Sorghum bicolor]